jgi:predicted PurR-regulated permease PerM
MISTRAANNHSRLFTMVAIFLVVAALWAAKAVLIPIALAILLTFILAPICNRLERWHLGHVMSVIVVAALSFIIIGVIGWIVAGQFIDLAAKLPYYRDNIRQKMDDIRIPPGGTIERITENLKGLTQEIFTPANGADPSRIEDPSNDEPIPVTVEPAPPGPIETMRQTIGPVLGPLASAGIVIVFVIFMLLQRNELRDKIIRLIGQGRLTVATQAIDDAASRVSRYLLMQFVINATYGVAVAIGLFFIGLPSAVLWGVLAMLVRFIPYVGPWIGAVLPILLSMAVFDRWTPVLLTAGLFVVIELISNNIMEPLLYGARTGISAVAVLASAVFWTWLWGPVGLVLATPLTVCVVVLGRYMTQLEFLNVLLSDEPGLSPAARVYQRLLAMDQDEVFEICESYLAETDTTLLDLYENVLLPALAMAERDRHHDRIDPDREPAVYQGMRDLVEELGERKRSEEQTVRKNGDAAGAESISPAARGIGTPDSSKRIACVTARDAADEIAAIMFAHVLQSEGIRAQVFPQGIGSAELVSQLEADKPDAICISAVPPQTVVRTRQLCQRLSARLPQVKIVTGVWTLSDVSQVQNRLGACQSEHVVGTFADAIAMLRRYLNPVAC